ncbi:MAG TPA: hypothetical protein VMV69_01795, partial [Pirellulales bacterium]|nr:hypothetical protein [Pirellulales bacterium]
FALPHALLDLFGRGFGIVFFRKAPTLVCAISLRNRAGAPLRAAVRARRDRHEPGGRIGAPELGKTISRVFS